MERLRLFAEVADLVEADRRRFYENHEVAPGLRAEIESLLRFDSAGDVSPPGCVGAVAERAFTGDAAEGLRCGPYEIERELGRGGMGAVYLAHRADGEVRQTVAVKLLRLAGPDSGFTERFLQERQILASLNHPGVTRLIDAGHTSDGRPYLVMEYVAGMPIDAYCRDLNPRAIVELLLKVCEALSYAHRNLIIHRDLKPSNILVETGGNPKLLDFGIARILEPGSYGAVTVDRFHTPDFASPEQLAGGVCTTATDIYSIGAVLFFLLTGRAPRASEHPTNRLSNTVPRDLDFIIRKALRPEPGDRYPSMTAFADDLRAFLERRPVGARSGNAWYRTRKFVRRYWMAASGAAVVIFSLSAGLYVADRQRSMAESRVVQLRRLSGQLLDFERQLRFPNAGTDLQIHNKITATYIGYLESLRREAGTDRQLALDIGGGYLQLARIQGVPEWNQQGKYDEAEKSLQKAGEIARSILAADSKNRGALWLEANVAHDLAVIAYTERHPKDVIAWSPRAVAGFEQLAQLGNLTRREINGATYIYGDLAEIHSGLHRFRDAAHYARLAIDYSQNNSTVPGPRAQAFNMLAEALTGMGDLQGAQEAVEEARRLWDQLLHDEGVTYYSQLMLSQTRTREGLLLGEDGGVNLNEPGDAATRLQEAFDVLEDTAQKDRNNYETRTDIGTAGHYLGDLLRHSDPQRALDVYDHALLRVREVPEDVAARRLEVLLLAGSSYAARSVHRDSDAASRIDAALRLLRGMGEYPAAVIKPGSEADVAARALADHDAETGRLGEAIRRYQELRRSVLASHPEVRSDLPNAVSVTRLDASLAALLRRAGEQDQAAPLESGNRDLWRYWDHQLPGNPFVERELAAQ